MVDGYQEIFLKFEISILQNIYNQILDSNKFFYQNMKNIPQKPVSDQRRNQNKICSKWAKKTLRVGTHLGTNHIFMMIEKAFNYFRKKGPHFKFDSLLNTPEEYM